jgi:Protein of unknown function (DUF4230)
MTSPSQPASPRRRRLLAAAAIVAAAGIAALAFVRQRREERGEELVIVEGIRKVCKLATIEVTLADYARRTVPKTIDLPFTDEPEAYLFYSGVVTAGFDVCDEPTKLEVDHAARLVRLAVPPPRILSLDIKRFETINESSGFLNAISPADRNSWYQSARDDLTKAALAQGVLPRAETHARELLGDLVTRWGYRLDLAVGGAGSGAAEPERR